MFGFEVLDPLLQSGVCGVRWEFSFSLWITEFSRLNSSRAILTDFEGSGREDPAEV